MKQRLCYIVRKMDLTQKRKQQRWKDSEELEKKVSGDLLKGAQAGIRARDMEIMSRLPSVKVLLGYCCVHVAPQKLPCIREAGNC